MVRAAELWGWSRVWRGAGARRFSLCALRDGGGVRTLVNERRAHNADATHNLDAATMTPTPHRRLTICPANGTPCPLWQWTPPAGHAAPGGLVVIFHGLAAHARFPTVRLAAERLASAGFVVVAVDFPGHGDSPGMRAYIPSAESLIEHAVEATRAASAVHESLPVFLLGSSMGGAIALHVADRLTTTVSGVVLLAPMLASAVDSAFVHTLVSALSYTPLARLALIPSSATDNAKQYADPVVLREIEQDTLAYKGNLRVASVAAVLDLGAATEALLPSVAAPFLCLCADREQVLGPASQRAAGRLLEVAATPAGCRSLKRYDALHGLLCEEEPLRSAIVDDIVGFLRETAAARPEAAEQGRELV